MVNFHNAISPIANKTQELNVTDETIVQCNMKLLVYSSRTYFLLSYITPLTPSETTQYRLV